MRSIAMVAACPFPANYGSSASIRELANILGDRGYNVHVVTYPIGEPGLQVKTASIWRTAYWRKEGRTYTGPAGEKFILDLLMVFKLIQVIRREKIEVIHAHNYEGVLIGMIAKLFTGRPLVYQAVNLMSDELPTYNFIKPAFVARKMAAMLDWIVPRLPDFVIVISQELQNYFGARGFGNDRLALIPPGIYPAMFANPNPRRFRDYHSLGSRKVVMYAGVTNTFQRIDYLLEAFKVVLAAEPSTVLMVVSPIAQEPDLVKSRELASSLAIADNVIWVEGQKLDDLPDYLAVADIAVIPRPNIPGYPLKLLNYLAAEKPVVCFDSTAKGVKHLHDIFTVPDHDVLAMGNAIVKLLREPKLAARLAKNGKNTVLTRFDWEVLCTDIEAVYSRVMGAKPPDAAWQIDSVPTAFEEAESATRRENSPVPSESTN
jgi:glycosyltransferase involved in cell wall biosynthesis